MKKIFFFLVFTAIAFTTNSCSSSDSSPDPGGTISFKVNGVQKTFTDMYVSENLYFEGTPDEYTELYVVTLPANDPEHVRFTLYKNHMEDSVSVFYTHDGIEYTRVGTFTMQITANGNNKKLIGTFSGEMAEDEINPVDQIYITEGTFNIQY